MADTDLPISGKDTRVQMTVDGVLTNVHDAITKFDSKPVYDEIQTKHIGVSGSKIRKVFSHREGSIEMTISRGEFDDIIDAVTSARIAGIPMVINVTENITYTDNSNRSYVCPDVKLDFDRRTERASSNTLSVPWTSGVDRRRVS